ncbi:hypothetical protein HNR59_002891 [Aquamicrobium lusatiense]|uniref:Uncharacterized protein n=1 Tax=Aquamicrobium lusatiense TaxID=89772 RepID=A0A7W9VWW1_9HYPH|nr:hypothetical protein [Aquamicrobium lusatiense]MBB6013502.1 hypothetical protein [Aquamicrobium lusatiense]
MSEIIHGTAEGPISGSIVVNDYVQRSVKVLAIHEHEVEHISFMNGLSAFCFSTMSAFASFAAATWVSASLQSTITPATQILTTVIGPGALILGVIVGILGFLVLRRRGSTLKTIKGQTITVVDPSTPSAAL